MADILRPFRRARSPARAKNATLEHQQGPGGPPQAPVGRIGSRQARRAAGHLLLAPQGRAFYMLYVYAKNEERLDPCTGEDPETNRTGGIPMKAAAFKELVVSVRQAGRIRRGARKRSRRCTFRPADANSVELERRKRQSELACMI